MITIPVKVSLGSTIERTITEAKQLASLLLTTIEFDFNGAKMYVRADTIQEDAVQEYHRLLAAKDRRGQYA